MQMGLQLRLVPELGKSGQSMLIRMMAPVSGRTRLWLGFVGTEDKYHVFVPVARAVEFQAAAEIIDIRPEGYADRYVFTVRSDAGVFGRVCRKFVFAGASLNGTPVSRNEHQLWQSFIVDTAILTEK